MTKMMPTISMANYKPDEKAINMALWGKETPPNENDAAEMQAQVAERLKKLRENRDQTPPLEVAASMPIRAVTPTIPPPAPAQPVDWDKLSQTFEELRNLGKPN